MVIFIITLITSIRAFNDPVLIANFIFNPFRVVRNKEYQRLLTHGLIHADIAHLAFNMITFYFFAFSLEYTIGHLKFALLYIGSLVLSSLTTLQKHKDNPAYNALGASGAISAVLLSSVLFDPGMQLLMFGFLPIPGWLFAILYIGYSQYASRNSNDNIGHEAHLWGALSGIALTFLLEPKVFVIIKAFIDSKL